MQAIINKSPIVSIIVPIYKVENYLTQCIESIRNQTLLNIEIILVDEGENDRCREIIDYYEKIDPRIITDHDKHGGYGNAVNKGLSLAQGKYIGIVESDDFIDANMYHELVLYADYLNADVVQGPFFEWEDGTPETYGEGRKKLMLGADFISTHVPQNSTYTLMEFPAQLAWHPSIWTGLYRTSYVRTHNIHFDEKGAYLDHKFRLIMLANAERIAWYNKPFYYWRITNPLSTNAKWNINEALKRWHDLHTNLNLKEPLFSTIAPYVIKEEYVNTFSHIFLEKCSSKQLIEMKKNLEYYSIKHITSSPVLNSQEKTYLLNMKSCKLPFRVFYCKQMAMRNIYYLDKLAKPCVYFSLAILFYLYNTLISHTGISKYLAIVFMVIYIISAGLRHFIDIYRKIRGWRK